MKIIAGLGNPGSKYENTRHNAGFVVLDLLASELGVEVKKKKFGACIGETELFGNRIMLLKPWQFMNLSGHAIATAMGFYKLDINDLLVISDDMAIDVGRIRLRSNGSSGGHNGLKDIIAKTGSNEFARLRVGIGQSDSPQWYDYVLSKPNKDEVPILNQAIIQAKQAVMCWAQNGIQVAMNEYNCS